MQSIDLTELDRLLTRWDSILKTYPEAKGSVLEKLGTELLDIVRDNIRNSGMKNAGGRLPLWQSYHVGSLRGYVSVRAIGSGEGASIGKNSPGAITNYTENGHRIRKPSSSGKRRYRPRITVPAVNGYHYYHRAEGESESVAYAEIKRFVDELAQRMGGAA
jgi:hypothetical protein